MKMQIRSLRDLVGGSAIMGLGLAALFFARELPGVHGFAFGAGTVPRLVAALLMLTGLTVATIGVFWNATSTEQYSWRLSLSIFSGLLFFIATVNGLGFEVAGSIGILLAASSARRMLFVIAAVLFFAASIRPLGLILSVFGTLMLSAAGTSDIRWRETVLCALLFTALCSFLFTYVLALPLQLLPRGCQSTYAINCDFWRSGR